MTIPIFWVVSVFLQENITTRIKCPQKVGMASNIFMVRRGTCGIQDRILRTDERVTTTVEFHIPGNQTWNITSKYFKYLSYVILIRQRRHKGNDDKL